MTPIKIPHCPFCGTDPELGSDLFADRVKCSTVSCPSSYQWTLLEIWCKRAPHEELVKYISSDEPIFILRAQDQLAPSHVRMWLEDATIWRVPKPKLESAALEWRAMNAWQISNPTKVPD